MYISCRGQTIKGLVAQAAGFVFPGVWRDDICIDDVDAIMVHSNE